MNELQIDRADEGFEVYVNGSPKHEAATYAEARAWALAYIARNGGELFE